MGTLRMTGDMQGPDPRLEEVALTPGHMGQAVMEPPSVEGWQTGSGWINTSSLVKRVNFVADRVSNTELPGVKDIIGRVASNGSAMTAEALLDRCLDMMGPMELSERSHREIVEYIEGEGLPTSWATEEEYGGFSRLVADVLALIGSTIEYQYG